MQKDFSQAILFIVSAPSGGGKSSVLKSVLADNPEYYYSISCTTRQPRANELDGRDYHFLSEEVFQEKIKANRFLEHAHVHNNYYGTLIDPILAKFEDGIPCFLDIDIQGRDIILANYKKGNYSWKIASIFITPPSMDVLVTRLTNRNTESAEDLKLRLKNAEWEMAQAKHYDHVVVNDDLSTAIADFKQTLSKFGLNPK